MSLVNLFQTVMPLVNSFHQSHRWLNNSKQSHHWLNFPDIYWYILNNWPTYCNISNAVQSSQLWFSPQQSDNLRLGFVGFILFSVNHLIPLLPRRLRFRQGRTYLNVWLACYTTLRLDRSPVKITQCWRLLVCFAFIYALDFSHSVWRVVYWQNVSGDFWRLMRVCCFCMDSVLHIFPSLDVMLHNAECFQSL